MKKIYSLFMGVLFTGCMNTQANLKTDGIYKVYGHSNTTYIKIIDDKVLKRLSSMGLSENEAIAKLKSIRAEAYTNRKRAITVSTHGKKIIAYMTYAKDKKGKLVNSEFLTLVNGKVVNRIMNSKFKKIDLYNERGINILNHQYEDITIHDDCKIATVSHNFKSFNINLLTGEETNKKRVGIDFSKLDLTIPPKYAKLKKIYKEVEPFGKIGYLVRLEGEHYENKTGLINENEEILIPLEYKESEFHKLSDSLIIVGKERHIKRDGRIESYPYDYALFDIKKKKILFKADFLLGFKSQNQIAFEVDNQTGVIDLHGNIVLPLQREYRIVSANNGIAEYRRGNYTKGLIDFKLNEIVETTSAISFYKDYILVRDGESSLVYDYNKNILIDGNSGKLNFLSEGVFSSNRGNKVGAIDITRKEIIPRRYNYINYYEQCHLYIAYIEND